MNHNNFINNMAVAKQSPIHGFGLFAKKAIRKGQSIGRYEGVLINDAEFKEQYGDDTRFCYRFASRVYPYWRGYIVGKEEPYLSTNASHYCNESLNPNVRLLRCKLVAIRDIEEGEELFLRYPANYPRDYELIQNQ